MTLILESLRVGGLTNFEAGQLINRHLTDLAAVETELLSDLPYKNYLGSLNSQSAIYGKAVAQVQANENTAKIVAADDLRDRAVLALGVALRLYGYSDNADEQEAARVLSLTYKSFKGIEALNYEAETQAIDKLLSEFAKTEAVANIAKLGIGRWVSLLQTSNDAFRVVFSTRIQSEAFAEVYNMKAVRKQIYLTYFDFCNYVLSMAKATGGEAYISALNLINTARAYYALILARRAGSTSEPVTDTTL